MTRPFRTREMSPRVACRPSDRASARWSPRTARVLISVETAISFFGPQSRRSQPGCVTVAGSRRGAAPRMSSLCSDPTSNLPSRSLAHRCSPLLNRCQGTWGALAGFTAVKPSNDHLIHDQEAQTTVPHAARVVGPLGSRTGPTLALCRSPAAAAPSHGFGGRFHGGEALRRRLNS